MSASADSAAEVLEQVEDHCIQPGKSVEHFMSTPVGWNSVKGPKARELILTAARYLVPWIGIERSSPSDDRAAVLAEIEEQVADKQRDLIDDYNNGELRVFRHDESDSVLVIELDGRRWLHLSCLFWPAADNGALQALILNRWTLPIPKAKTSEFGGMRSVNFNIRINDVPAELGVDVYRVPADAGPVPVYLELTLLPL